MLLQTGAQRLMMGWPHNGAMQNDDRRPITKGQRDSGDFFIVDRRGIIRFATGERARAAEIQSVKVSIRRNTSSSFQLWIAWFLLGLIVNAAMGAKAGAGGYDSTQSTIFWIGLAGGPCGIYLYRASKGVFLDVMGSGSLITSLEIGRYSPETEAKAYALSDRLIWLAEENS